MKSMRYLATALVVLALALFAAAQEQQREGQQQAQQQEGQEQQLTGTVVSVDAQNNQLTVRDEQGQEHMVKVETGTQIASDTGESIRLEQLSSGDRVTLTVRQEQGQMMASRIEVQKAERAGLAERREGAERPEAGAEAGIEGPAGAERAERLPETATPLPLLGLIGLLLLAAGTLINRISR